MGYKISTIFFQPLLESISDLQVSPPPKTVSLLRRFLEMLNFYRHFLQHAATNQDPLQGVLSGPKIKGSHPITWNDALVSAFKECEASLSQAALLAHTHLTAPLTFVTDASTTAMGAVSQQRVKTSGSPSPSSSGS